MVKTVIGIEGMTCGMCEAHINNVIRENFHVKKVTSSRKKGETVVISTAPLDESALKQVIAGTGYSVTFVRISPYEKKGLFDRLLRR